MVLRKPSNTMTTTRKAALKRQGSASNVILGHGVNAPPPPRNITQPAPVRAPAPPVVGYAPGTTAPSYAAAAAALLKSRSAESRGYPNPGMYTFFTDSILNISFVYSSFGSSNLHNQHFYQHMSQSTIKIVGRIVTNPQSYWSTAMYACIFSFVKLF